MLSFDDFFLGEIAAGTTDQSVDFSLNAQLRYSSDQIQFIEKHFLFSAQDLYSIRQIHGDELFVIKDSADALENYREADGIIANVVNLPIAIRTADCVPVFLYDREKRCIGLIHAGWKSTQKKIIKKALDVFEKQFNSVLSDILVAIGPSIRSCCYEVDASFGDYFPEDVVKKGSLYLDLVSANKRQLIQSGINRQNIYDCQICTMCDQNYFSYRRQGSDAGRMLSVMMMKERKECM